MTKITRDQKRALHAYGCVKTVEDREDYKVAVNDLGTTILRSGLAAALAVLERQNRKAVTRLRDHLAEALNHLPQLEGADGKTLPDKIRGLEVTSYMLATREALKVATWLKRAVQATFKE